MKVSLTKTINYALLHKEQNVQECDATMFNSKKSGWLIKPNSLTVRYKRKNEFWSPRIIAEIEFHSAAIGRRTNSKQHTMESL